MSTITNILPYPIDVCVRTTPYPVGKGKKFKKNTKNNKNRHSLKGMGLSGLNVEETVFYAKNIDVGDSQHVPNPMDESIQTISMSIRPSPLTLYQYYENHFNQLTIPYENVQVGNNESNIMKQGNLNTIFEQFEQFEHFTPFTLLKAALNEAKRKGESKDEVSRYMELAEANVIHVLYQHSLHRSSCKKHPKHRNHQFHKYTGKKWNGCNCSPLPILHHAPIVYNDSDEDETDLNTQEEKETKEIKETKETKETKRPRSLTQSPTFGTKETKDTSNKSSSNDSIRDSWTEKLIKKAFKFILNNPSLPIDHDVDAMHACSLKSPLWSDPVEFVMKQVEKKKGSDCKIAKMLYAKMEEGRDSNQRKEIEKRQVTITMKKSIVEPKRKNFWPKEKVCLHTPDSTVVYEVHKREYLDEYDNSILDLHDPNNITKLYHIDTNQTNIYLIHDTTKVKATNSYNFEMSSQFFISNRTGLNLTYKFYHRGEIHPETDLPENVHGCDLHYRFNNYNKLMVPKVQAYISHPPMSRMCHFDPPVSKNQKITSKNSHPTSMSILIKPKIR